MQKLALMMAVMILGMSPAHGCSIGANLGSQGVEDQAGMTLPPSTWSGGDGKTLMAKGRISSAAAEGNQPVEPGGHSIGRILQQIQLGVEGLGRIRSEILRIGQDKAKQRFLEKGIMDPARGRRVKATDLRVKRCQRRQKL